ncbi:MAG: PH domain-containing protein [Erythrobacter sp.]
MSGPQRTAPTSVVLGAVNAARGAIIGAAAIAFSGVGGGERLWLAGGIFAAAAVIGTASGWLKWRRLTYTIGETDIRVESGVLSRSARSVPFERIQDVSLEAKLLPRLFGLVSVKFETGAGGGEDLALEYLSTSQGEALRRLVRERRDEGEAASAAPPASVAALPAHEQAEDGEVLYAVTPRRLLTFGAFEFSLAVFAVLGGALQYADNFVDVWDVDLWYRWLKEEGAAVANIGLLAQALAALAGLIGLVAIGFATGVVRTVLRDWGFTLTRSARGFRRRRGLLNTTDVIMPAHRVQGLVVNTGLVRYRFGWRSLSFVSLAQDEGGESHVVAPFATLPEIDRIARSAGFRLPDGATRWHRASKRHRNVMLLRDAAAFVVLTIVAAVVAPFGLFLIPLGMILVSVGVNLYAWEFRRHALDEEQVYASHGFFSPTQEVAQRLKLHSVEIVQGPVARASGYATVHLGLAGGSFVMHGVPLAEARALRAAVMKTIAATDYSRLDRPSGAQALSAAHSGFSANRLAT